MATPDAPSDPPKRQVGDLAYTDEGDGRTFLLVHGLPGSGRDFRWLAPVLAAHARVVRIDMPGFGGSPLSGGLDVDARADFVLAAVRTLGLEAPVVVGHSIGGVLATAAATRAPELFSGLVLVSSPGARPHRGFRIPRRTLAGLVSFGPTASLLRGTTQAFFRRAGFRHSSFEENRLTLQLVAQVSIEAHAARLARVDLPTLHAFAADDPLVEVEIMRDAAKLTQGQVLEVPDGGHNPQKHHAVEIGAAMRALFP
ncbi:MAG: alpha/beta hydrolase [Myxococcota bacterium]